MSGSTPKTVAESMANEFRSRGELYQDDAAYSIQRDFGDDFVYVNDNGNLAIDKKVLAEFRKLTANEAVWVRSERYWRRREGYDDPNKRVAD